MNWRWDWYYRGKEWFHHKIDSVQLMDYPRTQLYISVRNVMERKVRSHPCRAEPATVKWIESMPSHSVLFEIGANVGSYSLIAGSLGHTVYAFEPAVNNYSSLHANIWRNGLQDFIIPVPIAASAVFGFRKLNRDCTPSGRQVANAGFRWEEINGEPTLCLPIDEFAYLNPNFLKIDVDGDELGVLNGAKKILPFISGIMIESFDKEWKIVGSRLRDMGFEEVDWRYKPDMKHRIKDHFLERHG